MPQNTGKLLLDLPEEIIQVVLKKLAREYKQDLALVCTKLRTHVRRSYTRVVCPASATRWLCDREEPFCVLYPGVAVIQLQESSCTDHCIRLGSSNIKELQVFDGQPDRNFAPLLQSLPCLERMTGAPTTCFEDLLEHATQLKEIHLRFVKDSHFSLQGVSALQHLQALEIPPYSKGLQHLEHLARLASLTLQGIKQHQLLDLGSAVIPRLTALTSLSVAFVEACPCPEKAMALDINSRSLKSLHYECPPPPISQHQQETHQRQQRLGNYNVLPSLNCPQLTSLHLTRPSDSFVFTIPRALTALHKLTCATDAVFVNVPAHTLTALKFTFREHRDSALEPPAWLWDSIGQLTRLVVLEVQTLPPRCCAKLTQLTGLQHMHLGFVCNPSWEHLVHFTSMTSLKTLGLMYYQDFERALHQPVGLEYIPASSRFHSQLRACVHGDIFPFPTLLFEHVSRLELLNWNAEPFVNAPDRLANCVVFHQWHVPRTYWTQEQRQQQQVVLVRELLRRCRALAFVDCYGPWLVQALEACIRERAAAGVELPVSLHVISDLNYDTGSLEMACCELGVRWEWECDYHQGWFDCDSGR